MEHYPITINMADQIHQFDVGEYPHHNDENCKYKVFENGLYVASFEPDNQHFLHVCQNPGGINEELLHLLADEIEAHHPQATSDNIKKSNL